MRLGEWAKLPSLLIQLEVLVSRLEVKSILTIFHSGSGPFAATDVRTQRRETVPFCPWPPSERAPQPRRTVPGLRRGARRLVSKRGSVA